MKDFLKKKVYMEEKNDEINLEEIINDYLFQKKKNTLIPYEKKEIFEKFTKDLSKIEFIDNHPEMNMFIYNEKISELIKKYKIIPKKSQIYYLYRLYKYKKEIKPNIKLEKHLISKAMLYKSDVLIIYIMMPPDNLSHNFDCNNYSNDLHYSHNYYIGKSTYKHGNQNNFDAYKQFNDRVLSYLINGYNIDKVECVILGKTFNCYNPIISEYFITQLYYAANNILKNKNKLLSCGSLEEEIQRNENSLCRIIGITIEIQPNKISKHKLRRLRNYGVTCVQIKVRHTDDTLLNKLNYQYNQKQIIRAIKLLKDNCFKVSIYLIPDLPGSSLQKDYNMFAKIINDFNYQVDQWKICSGNILEFEKIKEYYNNDECKHYANSNFEEFFNMIIWLLVHTPPWIHIHTIQCNLYEQLLKEKNKYSNFRQMINIKMKKNNYISHEIKWNEVKNDTSQIYKARLVSEFYYGSDGIDIFLSHKSCSCLFCWSYFYFQIMLFIYSLFGLTLNFYGCGFENKIYSFLRLRINGNDYNNCFSKIYQKKAKIRELHEYNIVNLNHKSSKHFNFREQLLQKAEFLAKSFECDGMMVIAGVGTRNYYRDFGYEIFYEEKNHGGFMVKYF